MSNYLLQIDVSKSYSELKEDDLINIKLSSGDHLQVKYSKLVDQSKYVRDEYKYSEAVSSFQSEISKLENDFKINDESIKLFIQLIHEEKMSIPIEHYRNFCTLSEYFQTPRFTRALDDIMQHELCNDLNFTIQVLLDSKSMKNNFETKLAVKIETFLASRINECLKNQKFKELPMSTIFRIFVRSDKERFNVDWLIDFIFESVETRYFLLKFVRLHKLADDKVREFFKFMKEQEKETRERYLEHMAFDLSFIVQREEKYDDLFKIFNQTKQELNQTKQELNQTKQELNQTKQELNQTKQELNQTKQELNQTKQELNQTKQELNQTKQELNQTKQELNQTKQELNQTKQELNQTKQELNQTKQELNQTKQELNQTKQELNQTKQELNQTKQDLNQTKQDLNQTKQVLNKTKQDLNKTKQDLNKTKQDLNKTKITNEQKKIQIKNNINEKLNLFNKQISDFTVDVDSHLEKIETIRKNVLKKQQFLNCKQFVFILLDKSGSMASLCFNQRNRFDFAKKIITNIIDNIKNYNITSIIGSIMFNDQIQIKNPLNLLSENFLSQMFNKGERPGGPTNSFGSILKAAEQIIESNKKFIFNITKRIIIISDGEDAYASPSDKVRITNFLISNEIRVDSLIISDTIVPEIALVSLYTGGICLFSNNAEDYFDFINQREFINPENREFGEMHLPNLTINDFSNKKITIQDIETKIKIKKKKNS